MYTDVAIIVGNYKQDTWFPQAIYSAENQIVPHGADGKLPTYQVVPSTDNKGIGASAHRNRAIQATDADWFIWLDADDLIPSNYLYELWHSRFNREYNLVYAPMQFISGCRLDRFENIRLGEFNVPFGMSAMFSKKMWIKVCGFDETLFNMNDIDFWLRIRRVGYKSILSRKTYMFKRDVPESLLKKGDSHADEILAQFNAKHNLDLKTKILPYLVPRTNIL